MQKKVLLALEDAGVFTSGGLVKDKVKLKGPDIILLQEPIQFNLIPTPEVFWVSF